MCPADPRRKLARSDRLIGPILLCRQHDLPFEYLARAAAAALHPILQYADECEQINTIKKLCGLNADEGDIVNAIAVAYYPIQWAALAEQAGKLAFDYEQTFHGCGQCAFAAISETLGNFDNAVFEAATGLAGGLGLAGDSTCGALLGATLTFGLVSPRHRDQFSGDKENKYRSFRMAQKLRQKYLDTYGSIRCHDIHRQILGRPFDLRDPAERKAFEAAGAHNDKCTDVVAHTAQWAVEIIGEEMVVHKTTAGVS
jgi:C_GCAxxG_C_C family probable redox protein